MLQRCAVGGPKLSPQDRRIASLFMLVSALVMATLYIVLTKIYRAAPAVQALFYATFPALTLIYGQTAYLRKRPWLTQVFILGAGLLGMYLFMLAACVVGNKL
jgi:drug/metabolite transporter (DMT)-like permease